MKTTSNKYLGSWIAVLAVISTQAFLQQAKAGEEARLPRPQVSVSFVSYTNSPVTSGRLALIQIENQSEYLFFVRSNWTEVATSKQWKRGAGAEAKWVVSPNSQIRLTVPAPAEGSSWRAALLFQAECSSGMTPKRSGLIRKLEAKGQRQSVRELICPRWIFRTSVISNDLLK